MARYLYALLTPKGLRWMTPTVVYAELFAAPVALLGSYIGSKKVTRYSIAIICSLHMGIALTVRNTVLLSSVACAIWCVYLPTFDGDVDNDADNNEETQMEDTGCDNLKKKSFQKFFKSYLFIIPIICGSIWFETMSEECNQSMKHIWSVLLHNRWNVFVGAEVRGSKKERSLFFSFFTTSIIYDMTHDNFTYHLHKKIRNT